MNVNLMIKKITLALLLFAARTVIHIDH